MVAMHQPTKHRVSRQTSSASPKKFFAIRKCDTLAAPAIFWNWEDCKYYIDSNENEAVEYRVCGGLKQAVEYIVGNDHNLESDDAKPRQQGSPTNKLSFKKKRRRSSSASSLEVPSLEDQAAQQLVTMTSTTAKRPRTSNETADFPSPIIRSERPNNTSLPLGTVPPSLAIMRFNYVSQRKICNFTVKAPIAPASNRRPAPAVEVPKQQLSYTFGKWMISVNERIADALSKTMIEFQKQREQRDGRQQRLSFEDSDVPELRPPPKHTCRFILKPKHPVAQDSDLRDLFPVVLYDMLEDADADAYELDSIIHWLPSGQNFRIDNPSWLVQYVLPIYFDKHITTYNDFLGQLTRWGFEGGAGVFFHSDFVKNDRNISWRIVQEGPRGVEDRTIGENSIPFMRLCDSDGEDSDEEDSDEVTSLAASEQEADASAAFLEEGYRPFIKPSPPKRKQGTASNTHTTEEQHRWSPPDNRRGWIPAASPPEKVDYSKTPMEWFPSMLFSVLEDTARVPTRDQIISWNPDGKSFSIWKPRPFKSDVLGPYFGNLDYAEFQDQLRLWGFQSVQPSVPGQPIEYSRKNFELDKRGFCYLLCRDHTALKASQMLKEGNDKHTAGPSEGSNDNSVATSVTPFKQAKASKKKVSRIFSAQDGLFESDTDSEEEVDKDDPRLEHLCLQLCQHDAKSDAESEEAVEEDSPRVEDLCLQVCQQYLESKQKGRVRRYGESPYLYEYCTATLRNFQTLLLHTGSKDDEDLYGTNSA